MLLGAVDAGGAAGHAGVVEALREATLDAVAYPRTSAWDAKGDNVTTVTALNIVRGGLFETFAVVANTSPLE